MIKSSGNSHVFAAGIGKKNQEHRFRDFKTKTWCVIPDTEGHPVAGT